MVEGFDGSEAGGVGRAGKLLVPLCSAKIAWKLINQITTNNRPIIGGTQSIDIGRISPRESTTILPARKNPSVSTAWIDRKPARLQPFCPVPFHRNHPQKRYELSLSELLRFLVGR
jgi:hypothetical protein